MPKVIPFGHRQTQKAERNAGGRENGPSFLIAISAEHDVYKGLPQGHGMNHGYRQT